MRQTKLGSAVLALPLLLAALWPGETAQGAKMFTTRAGESESVTPGMWGGDHIRMQVTEDGARIEYDCAHSSIDHKLTTDDAGRFRAKGTYVRERGGPEREDGEKGVPAQYSGRTDGKTMTLTITLSGTGEKLGPFTLTYGKKVRVVKCM